MIFNGIEKDYVTVLRDRLRPFFEKDGERIIEVPILIEHNDFSNYQRLKEDIAGWLKHDDKKVLEFKDDDDRLYFAKVDDIVEGESYSAMSFAVVTFVCQSKYSHERLLSINEPLTTAVNGHKPTPWHTKTTFTANQTSYDIKFNSPGKTALRDINIIKLNYNFIKGDILKIDYSKREVMLNGNDITSTIIILQSNFMELPIGQAEFTASRDTELFYHERYY